MSEPPNAIERILFNQKHLTTCSGREEEPALMSRPESILNDFADKKCVEDEIALELDLLFRRVSSTEEVDELKTSGE